MKAGVAGRFAVAGAVSLIGTLPLGWMFIAVYRQGPGSGGAYDAAVNAGWFAGFAVIHSLLARDRAKRWMAAVLGEGGVRIGYVFIASATLSLLILAWRPLTGLVWRVDGWAAGALVTGFVLAIAGMVVTLRSIDYLEFMGVRGLLQRSRGRPLRTPRISVRGPYGYCRHPLYVGMVIAVWAAPGMSWTRFEFAALVTAYVLIGVWFEERGLRAELGPEYARYCRHVPMWIPRWRPWRG